MFRNDNDEDLQDLGIELCPFHHLVLLQVRGG